MARPVLYRVILQRWGWLLAGHIGPVSVWHSPVNILVYRNLQGSFSLSDKIKLRSPPKTTQNNIGLQPVAPRAGMEVTQQGWGNLNVPTAALQPPGGSLPPAAASAAPTWHRVFACGHAARTLITTSMVRKSRTSRAPCVFSQLGAGSRQPGSVQVPVASDLQLPSAHCDVEGEPQQQRQVQASSGLFRSVSCSPCSVLMSC